ncbi:MAG: hypothetical protein AAGI30_05650 [Planctomycetota bacterium]
MTVAPSTQNVELKHTLDDEVADVSFRVRAAYADLINALPEAGARPVDLQRVLGINKKLAWQVHRVATAQVPLNAGMCVPGVSASKQVIRAAAKNGVEKEITDRFVTATDDFHKAVERHADDRSAFELMVRSLTGEGLRGHELELKRSAFRVNREIYGKCCDVDFASIIVAPCAREGGTCVTSLRGLVNLRRLRPNVSLEIAKDNFTSESPISPRLPIDAALADDTQAVPLLTEFCHQPVPRISRHTTSDGLRRSFAETEGLGWASAATCFLGDVVSGIPLSGVAGNIVHDVATPASLLIYDCLIDERLVGDVYPELRVIGKKADALAWPGEDDSVLIPGHEQVAAMGTGVAAVSTAELPRYPEMLSYACDRLRLEADRLKLFRVSIEYPVLHSVVWMRFNLTD